MGRATRAGDGRPGERGISAVVTAMSMLVLIGFAGLAIDLGHWYLNIKRIQNTADAAALAGSVFMPADFPEASLRATTLANGHGYGAAGDTIVVAPGTQPNQLQVTISRQVPNFFVSIFGRSTTRISRSATAEYNSPVAMGSPASYLGNDPEDPLRTQPQHWMNIAGLRTSRQFGDRYHAGRCESLLSCSGPAPQNPDYVSDGYLYAVKVAAIQPGRDLVFEIFDPAAYTVGDTCDRAASSGFWGPAATRASNAAALQAAITDPSVSPYVPAGYYDDAVARYTSGPTAWCTGDTQPGSAGSADPIVTSYLVRGPDTTPWTDVDNPIIDDGLECQPRQFTGEVLTGPSVWNRLTPNADLNGEWRVDFPAGAWRQTLANSFRRWVTVCRIPAASVQTGSYILQVRTNAALGSPETADNSLNTQGHNRYAIRVGFDDGVDPVPVGSGVSVYARGRLPIFVNATAATTEFYAARVLPGSTQRVLRMTLWDISDMSGSGTMRILPPAGATVGGAPLTTFTGCTLSAAPTPAGGSWTPDGTTCQLSFKPYALDQRLTTIEVPIPNGYSCNVSDPNACWVKVRATSSAGVLDTTTWTADLIGNPVRLTE